MAANTGQRRIQSERRRKGEKRGTFRSIWREYTVLGSAAVDGIKALTIIFSAQKKN